MKKLLSQRTKRNSPCPCGSGKKVKHCCLTKIRGVQTQLDDGMTIPEILVDQILLDAPDPNQEGENHVRP